jgi:TolA-binding protein
MQFRSKIIFVFILAGLLAACGRSSQGQGNVTASDVEKESKEAAETTVDYTRQQYQAFMQQAKAKLDAIDQRMRELRDRAGQLQGEAQTGVREKLQELKQEREAIREKMTALKKSGAEAWKDMETGLKSAMERLDQALDRAVERFK